MAHVTCGLITIPFIFNMKLIENNVEIITPSGLGGIFSLEYLGLNDGKHHFRSLSKEFKYDFHWTDEEVFQNACWRCWIDYKLISAINNGFMSDLPNLLSDPLSKMLGDKPKKVHCSQDSFKEVSKLGALTNKLFEQCSLDKLY